MIKKIIVVFILLISFANYAQQGTASPYSYYGIGDIRYKGALENRSMGGIGVEQDSIHLNFQNPASFAALKLTTFTVAGTFGVTKLQTTNEKANAQRTTLDYLGIGIPIGKFGFGFGLIPYSSVGYKIASPANETQNNKRLEGSGGLNKVFAGLGYKIKPNFSIGADVHYNFGKIDTKSFEYITSIPVGTLELNNATLSGVNVTIGSLYQTKLNKKLTLFSSANYTFESILKSQNSRLISTALYNAIFELSVNDSFDLAKTTAELKLPSKLAIGLGLGEARKWMVGAEVTFREKGSLANNYNSIGDASFGNYSKYSLGGYYIPNYSSFTSYAKRITYRGGFRFEKTGLLLKSQSIDDKAITIGFGLPATGSFSNFNFGFEFGQKGTTKSGLVEENYMNFSVSMSLNDKWFERRKFN
jgi:long-subunit fatty acid transport protein